MLDTVNTHNAKQFEEIRKQEREFMKLTNSLVDNIRSKIQEAERSLSKKQQEFESSNDLFIHKVKQDLEEQYNLKYESFYQDFLQKIDKPLGNVMRGTLLKYNTRDKNYDEWLEIFKQTVCTYPTWHQTNLEKSLSQCHHQDTNPFWVEYKNNPKMLSNSQNDYDKN